jgi:hypothetical protein
MVQILEEKVVRFLLDKAQLTEVPRAALEGDKENS